MNTERFKQELLPYHRKLFAVAFRLLENSEEAADVVQEAYLKLWEKHTELERISNLEAYSTTLVRHLCLDRLRSQAFHQARDWIELEHAPEPSDEEQNEIRERAIQVKHIISQLPDPQRQVVKLRDIQGCSFDEIAKLTGMQTNHIRVILSRARKRIREEFTKWN